jgi:hypothetical protein
MRRLSSSLKDASDGALEKVRRKSFLVNSEFPYWVCFRQHGIALTGEILSFPEESVIGSLQTIGESAPDRLFQRMSHSNLLLTPVYGESMT